jgi:hypothetical protein
MVHFSCADFPGWACQEDGQLSWCAAQAPSYEKFTACYGYNPDDPAQRALLLQLIATNGDW